MAACSAASQFPAYTPDAWSLQTPRKAWPFPCLACERDLPEPVQEVPLGHVPGQLHQGLSPPLVEVSKQDVDSEDRLLDIVELELIGGLEGLLPVQRVPALFLKQQEGLQGGLNVPGIHARCLELADTQERMALPLPGPLSPPARSG